MACNLATSTPPGAWSGPAPIAPPKIAIEVATSDSFGDARHVMNLDALPEGDFAVKALLDGLPADQTVFYRMIATDLSDSNAVSQPVIGQFRTAPTERRDIRFVWSGDTAGQGWGIDDQGMRTYATMASHQPDFFIHSGDTIYADGPMQDEVEIDGGVWKNVVLTDEVRKVAETLDEFRARWKYNQMDEHVQAMSAMVPTLFQWDDHEVVNNWSPGKDLTGDDRYTEKSVPLLTARAARAFHEMTPISYTPNEPGRVYRKIAYGPLLDIFFLDLRTYRGANSTGMQDELTVESQVLGKAQLDWLKAALKELDRDMEGDRQRHAHRLAGLGQRVRRPEICRGGGQWRPCRAQGPRAGIRQPAALHPR